MILMEFLKWILIVTGIIFLICLVILLFAKIKVTLSFSKKENRKLRTRLDISVLGFKLKKEIRKAKKKKGKNQLSQKDNDKEDDMSFFEKAKKYYTLFLVFKDIYKKNSRKIRRTVCFDKIWLGVEFGLGEASKTGVATGGVWAGIYNVIAFAARIFVVSEPKVEVTPLYNEQRCELEGECIISARLANLIVTLVSVGISYYFISKKHKSS